MASDNSRALTDLEMYSYPFSQSVRPPDWLPDTLPHLGHDDEVVFPEEAIGYDLDRKKLIPFPMPKYKDTNDPMAVDFKEPPKTAGPDKWNEFNKWILGTPLKLPPEAGRKPFHRFLLSLTADCRRYNASLYRMRRLHFHWKKESGQQDMPANPHEYLDPKTPLDDKNSQAFRDTVAKAEADWERVTRELRLRIEDGLFDQQGRKVKVRTDMVRVNGYIVSIRTVAEFAAKDEEFPGISSSHNSLSSAFSSSRP